MTASAATNHITQFTIASESNLNLIQCSWKHKPTFITPSGNICWILGPFQRYDSLYWMRLWGGGIDTLTHFRSHQKIKSKSHTILNKTFTNLHHTQWQYLMTSGPIPTVCFFVLEETVRGWNWHFLSISGRIQIESKAYPTLTKTYTYLHHTQWQYLMTSGPITSVWFFALDETVRGWRLSLITHFKSYPNWI